MCLHTQLDMLYVGAPKLCCFGLTPTPVSSTLKLCAGAYIARQAAKSVVAARLARRCLVQISYAIGVAQPLSVHVDTYGTGTKPDKNILALVLKNFDFRPGETCPRP